jgi:hypothetical protein
LQTGIQSKLSIGAIAVRKTGKIDRTLFDIRYYREFNPTNVYFNNNSTIKQTGGRTGKENPNNQDTIEPLAK